MTGNIDSDGSYSKKMSINDRIPNEALMISEPQIKLLLREYFEINLKKRYWISSLLFLIPILLTILTASFTETKFGIIKEVWEAIFYVIVIISAVLSIYYFLYYLKNINKGSIDELISKLRNEIKIEKTSFKIFEKLTFWNKKNLKITTALYGNNEIYINIKNELQTLIKNNQLSFTGKYNEIAKKDPLPNILKILIIEYHFNNSLVIKKFEEDDHINLPI